MSASSLSYYKNCHLNSELYFQNRPALKFWPQLFHTCIHIKDIAWRTELQMRKCSAAHTHLLQVALGTTSFIKEPHRVYQSIRDWLLPGNRKLTKFSVSWENKLGLRKQWSIGL